MEVQAELQQQLSQFKYRLIICSECFNVKAVVSNFIGTTSMCPCCKKMTMHYNTNNFVQAEEKVRI
jgi:hypothetical protein